MNFYYIGDGHVPEHMYNQRLNSRYQFSPTTWILGTKFRSPGLAASTSTH